MEVFGLIEGEPEFVRPPVPFERHRHPVLDRLVVFGPPRVDTDGQPPERLGIAVDGLVNEPTGFDEPEGGGGRRTGQSLLGRRPYLGLVVDETADLEGRALRHRLAHIPVRPAVSPAPPHRSAWRPACASTARTRRIHNRHRRRPDPGAEPVAVVLRRGRRSIGVPSAPTSRSRLACSPGRSVAPSPYGLPGLDATGDRLSHGGRADRPIPSGNVT